MHTRVWPLLFLCLLTFCNRTDNVVPAGDAQLRVNAAYFAKVEQCDQGADLLLFVPFDVQEPNLLACEIELLASGCPFTAIPLSCFLLLFTPAPGNDVDERVGF